MRYSIFGFLLTILFAGCTKEISVETGESRIDLDDQQAIAAVSCNVTSYSPIAFTGVTFGNGLVKTYYKSGLVKSVRTMVTDNHDYADSLIYNIVYYTSASNNLMAKVSCIRKHYVGVGYSTPMPNSEKSDEKYTITATLNPATHRLLKIIGSNDPVNFDGPITAVAGTYIMQYSGNRLLKFGNIEIKYDSAGNVTWIPKRPPGGAPYSVLYQYNHSKKAANQYYITSGYSVHEYYNLAEACNWIPVQPVNLRIRQSMFWGNYKAGELFFDQHVVDANGYLLSYRNIRFNQIVYNTWTCRQ